jgi:hypothetical protein
MDGGFGDELHAPCFDCVCLLLVRTVYCIKLQRPIRLGPEEIDRRERAPGAAAGMERMPSPPRARFSFCQPLSRPGPTPPRPAGAVCVLLGDSRLAT